MIAYFTDQFMHTKDTIDHLKSLLDTGPCTLAGSTYTSSSINGLPSHLFYIVVCLTSLGGYAVLHILAPLITPLLGGISNYSWQVLEYINVIGTDHLNWTTCKHMIYFMKFNSIRLVN